jgi:hypothetical protein
MIKKISFLCFTILSLFSRAQCDSVEINGDMIVSSDVLMSGTYVISGDFVLQSGSTIYVTPYSNNGCGELKIYAQNIVVDGTINGDYAGYSGGAGGLKGTLISSATGHTIALSACTDEGSEGQISVEGGMAGQAGAGPGAGIPGTNGGSGSGSKQYCGNFGDEAGLVAGAGGAGGGAGGAYGGSGTNAGNGGNGSNTSTTSGLSIQGAYPATFGLGGTGGIQSTIYGTAAGFDINMGSGGAGAGSGGRSFYLGTDGIRGGNGGGLVFLKGEQSVSVSGSISVNGEDGSYGGNGGSGDATTDCCSDGCNGCDERTFSCGSGAGAGSGAGSGGGIYIETTGSSAVSGNLSAKGGIGGDSGQKGNGAACTYSGGLLCSDNSINTGDGNFAGTGGSGGGGRIKIFTPECALAIVNPTATVDGGAGFYVGATGSYESICGYASLAENIADIDWFVYPNPVVDQFTVSFDHSNFSGIAKIDLVNALGQIIHSYEDVSANSSLSIPAIESGVYFVRLSIQNNTSIKKIIKK